LIEGVVADIGNPGRKINIGQAKTLITSQVGNINNGTGDIQRAGSLRGALQKGGLCQVIKRTRITAIGRIAGIHDDGREVRAGIEYAGSDIGDRRRYLDVRKDKAVPNPGYGCDWKTIDGGGNDKIGIRANIVEDVDGAVVGHKIEQGASQGGGRVNIRAGANDDTASGIGGDEIGVKQAIPGIRMTGILQCAGGTISKIPGPVHNGVRQTVYRGACKIHR